MLSPGQLPAAYWQYVREEAHCRLRLAYSIQRGTFASPPSSTIDSQHLRRLLS